MNQNDIDNDSSEAPFAPVSTATVERHPSEAEPRDSEHDSTPTETTQADSSVKASSPAVEIRAVEQSDFFAWYGLFSEYADFYKETLTDERAMRAWAWLHGAEYQTRGLVAVDPASGELVGIAHVRPFERALEGDTGLYLDDLYVRPDTRGRGVGRALLDAVAKEAREQGHGVVRWITAEDNATARKLYDSVAEKTPWVTYDISL